MSEEQHIKSKEGETAHVPVLLREALALLNPGAGMRVIDATLGGGGYTEEILKKVLPQGRVLALDADADAVQRFLRRVHGEPQLSEALASGALTVVQGNFADLPAIAESVHWSTVDGVVADLGFSQDQLNAAERGFSYVSEGGLDMRFDRGNNIHTAEALVNRTSPRTLERLLRAYGDESYAREIARAIVKRREILPLATTSELVSCILSVLPAAERRRRGRHPEAQAFQALRIAVNDELAALTKFLSGALQLLTSSGVLAVVSFHSGEDRIVKQFCVDASRGCVCPPSFPVCNCGRKRELDILTGKPIVPGPEEIRTNPRARSARLRAVRKK